MIFFKYTLIIFTLLIVVTSQSVAEPAMDKFTACKLYVLASNCNISRDKKSPAYMRKGGVESCFAGLDISPDNDEVSKSLFKKIIAEENYKREGLEEEISNIKQCLISLEALKSCDIGFVTAGGIKTVDFCQ